MGVYIYRRGSFYGLIEELKACGGRGALAAQGAERIIESLCRTDTVRPSLINRHTRYGESRIENCRKFDLGSGYRLVYVKHGQDYMFLFVGTHEHCDRWIKNHRGLEFQNYDEIEVPISPAQRECLGETNEGVSREDEMDYDEILMKKLDQKVLRKIFRGICRE